MPSFKTILRDLASVKSVLTTVVFVAGIVLAQIKPFGIPEADLIVGYVISAATAGVAIITAYTKGFTAAARPVPHG